MNRDLITIHETFSPEQTRELGRSLGLAALPGDVYCLDGELGTGKTVLAQGFAEGLGLREVVNSPTFTIIQTYESGRLPFYHMDVYRLSDGDELLAIGCEEYFYGDGVCLVEWACLVEEVMPEDAIHLQVEKVPEKGTEYRRITITRPARDKR